MNCKTIGENISAYLDKALPADEMHQVEAHLSNCSECRQELTDLQKTVALLTSLDEVIPPASFRRELRSKLEKRVTRKRFSWETLMQKLPDLRRSSLAPAAVAMILLIVALPFIIDMPNLGLSKAEKSKATQNSVSDGRGVAPDVATNFTTKGFDSSANKTQVTVGSADGVYGDNAGAPTQALTKSAPNVRMSTNFQVQDTAPKIAEPVIQERKIIKNADLQLQVDDYQQTVEAVKQQVISLGGYITNESVSAKDSQGSMRGNLQIRMPYLQFETFLNGIEGLGKVQNRNIYTQDVTEEFVDVESRLKAMQTKEERLLAILQNTGKLADLLAVENELANTRAELESLQGRLRFLSNRVDYSTINFNIEQVVVPTQTISTGGLQGVLMKTKEAFIKAINNILLDTGKLVVWIGSALPYLIILSVLVYSFWRWTRKKLG